jgi:chemosensory pili system protein ChpA (sensor histidine kinase/response regulator)
MYVLLVEDDAAIRSLMTLVLESEGFTVRSASDGLDALELIQRFRPAALVVDLDMPRMNGFDLIGACRADDQTRDLPIVAMSAIYGGGHVESVQVRAFLPKPFDVDTLVATLRDTLR